MWFCCAVHHCTSIFASIHHPVAGTAATLRDRAPLQPAAAQAAAQSGGTATAIAPGKPSGLIGFKGFIGFRGFIGFIGFMGFMGFIGFIGFMGFISQAVQQFIRDLTWSHAVGDLFASWNDLDPPCKRRHQQNTTRLRTHIKTYQSEVALGKWANHGVRVSIPIGVPRRSPLGGPGVPSRTQSRSQSNMSLIHGDGYEQLTSIDCMIPVDSCRRFS